ncbi:MAG: hypothetical protein AAB552_02835 [Patescibacteria group bacterium]
MLYLIHGSDRAKGRTQFQALKKKFLAEGCEVRVVAEGEATDGFLDTGAVSRGLFGETTLFTFDGVLEKKGEQEIFTAHAKDLAQSSNHFLIFEPTFEKESMGVLSKHATEIFEYVGKKVDTRPAFNIFSLGDALGVRKKKDLWVLYQQAIAAGLAPEELCGTLFWQVKNMALVKGAKSGDDCGLKPFVAQKARGFAKNYTPTEIVNLARALAGIFHEDHRGGEPMGIGLEKFILSL